MKIKGRYTMKSWTPMLPININFQNAVLKIEELHKQKQSLTIQYNRVLKQKDNIVQKHVQVLKNRKIAYGGSKICHKTEVSGLKLTWRCNVQDLKDKCMTDMIVK